MTRDRSIHGDRLPSRKWVLALLLLLPAGATAQDEPMTPEGASAALSQLGSIFLTKNTGFGRSGVFNTTNGQWVRSPERGLTYTCTVEAAVIPTTPDAQRGVSYQAQVQVFFDPDRGTIRVEGGDSNGWSRSEMPLADLHARFPDAPPPTETPPPETAGTSAPGNQPEDGSGADVLGGLLEILAGGLGTFAGEAVAVAELPPADTANTVGLQPMQPTQPMQPMQPLPPSQPSQPATPHRPPAGGSSHQPPAAEPQPDNTPRPPQPPPRPETATRPPRASRCDRSDPNNPFCALEDVVLDPSAPVSQPVPPPQPSSPAGPTDAERQAARRALVDRWCRRGRGAVDPRFAEQCIREQLAR